MIKVTKIVDRDRPFLAISGLNARSVQHRTQGRKRRKIRASEYPPRVETGCPAQIGRGGQAVLNKKARLALQPVKPAVLPPWPRAHSRKHPPPRPEGASSIPDPNTTTGCFVEHCFLEHGKNCAEGTSHAHPRRPDPDRASNPAALGHRVASSRRSGRPLLRTVALAPVCSRDCWRRRFAAGWSPRPGQARRAGTADRPRMRLAVTGPKGPAV